MIHRPWCERIDACDVRPPLDKHPKIVYREQDITDPRFVDWVVERAPDVLVHLAYVLDPIHDETRMTSINIGGTRHALEAAARAGVSKVMVASSGTAYGAWPDNPVPLKETDPIRPHPTFQYAREKAAVEAMCARFADEHPEVVLSIVRPCVLYGPNVRNYLSRLLTGLPVAIGLAGYEPELQFVHEDDVADAMLLILEQSARGAFNIAPPDTLSMGEVLRLTGKRVVRVPERVLAPAIDFMWRHHIPLFGAPSSFLDYLRYTWTLDGTRLREELGFEFRYSSRDALTVMLRAKRVLR
jgi:UDP-glucose 4-epimerase